MSLKQTPVTFTNYWKKYVKSIEVGVWAKGNTFSHPYQKIIFIDGSEISVYGKDIVKILKSYEVNELLNDVVYNKFHKKTL